VPVSRCIDIGHLWYDDYDPIPYLKKHIDRAKVLHIHGVSGRDHKSLSHVPFDELYRVIQFVSHSGFQGVMTVEVFGEEDFRTSMRAIQNVLVRITEEEKWEKN
jgi:sugar phosphate isomerase/epimerase